MAGPSVMLMDAELMGPILSSGSLSWSNINKIKDSVPSASSASARVTMEMQFLVEEEVKLSMPLAALKSEADDDAEINRSRTTTNNNNKQQTTIMNNNLTTS